MRLSALASSQNCKLRPLQRAFCHSDLCRCDSRTILTFQFNIGTCAVWRSSTALYSFVCPEPLSLIGSTSRRTPAVPEYYPRYFYHHFLLGLSLAPVQFQQIKNKVRSSKPLEKIEARALERLLHSVNSRARIYQLTLKIQPLCPFFSHLFCSKLSHFISPHLLDVGGPVIASGVSQKGERQSCLTVGFFHLQRDLRQEFLPFRAILDQRLTHSHSQDGCIRFPCEAHFCTRYITPPCPDPETH